MADDLDGMIARTFANWRPLTSIALADLPHLGDAAAVYTMRSKDGEILKFGRTKSLRNRLFKNYTGASEDRDRGQQQSGFTACSLHRAT